MRARPHPATSRFPAAPRAAAVLVFAVAAASLVRGAFVHADGGLAPLPPRAADARRATAGACDPEITSLSASSAPAAGNIPLTINGSNFRAAGSVPSVRFGHSVALVTEFEDDRIVVTCPPQRDAADASVRVVFADGRRSASVPFAYADPVIVPEPDALASFGGGTRLTIHGSDFRCSNPRAWLEDGATGLTAGCLVVAAADESLVVELPDWESPAALLHVGVVHRDLAARNVLFDGPQLAAVSPASFPATGNVPITITGSNFAGPDPAEVQVCRNGRCDAAPVVSASDVEIVALVPDLRDGSTGSSTVGVRVRQGGRPSRTFQAKADQDIASVRFASPAGGRAAGGTTITIFGDNFRSDASIGGITGGVIAGIVLGRQLAVTLPPLPPGVHALTVDQNGKPSAPLEIEVAAPPVLSSASPPVVPVEGRHVLTVHGANFGVSDFGLSRTVSVRQGGTTTNVGPVRWLAPEALSVVLPPGTPGPADLVVDVGGEEVVLPDAFTYAGTAPEPLPELVSMSPPALTRLGGNVITLTGSNFGSLADTRVIFGSEEVVPLTCTTGEITFVQPPLPTSREQNPIYVDKGQTGTNPLFGARGPAPVSGTTGGPAPFAGGTLLTIHGSDFGPGARVRFSSADGAAVERTALAVTPTSLVVCAPEIHEHAWNEYGAVWEGEPSAPQPYTLAGPTVTDVSERLLGSGGGSVLTIHGDHFTPGSTVLIEEQEFEGVQFNPKEITIDKPVPWRKRPGCPPQVPVRVRAADGTLSDSVMVRWKAPELNSQSDRAARAGGGGFLTITGQDFGAASTITIFGASGPESPAVVDRTPDELVVQLGDAEPGAYELVLGDPDLGDSPPVTLHRLGPPAVSSVSPAAVPLAGNIPITIFGSNFGAPGTELSRTVHLVGRDCPLEGLVVADDGLRVTAPPGLAGPADLVVTIDGVADTIPGAFEYSATAGVEPPPARPRELALRAGPTPFRGDLALAFAVPAAGRWTLELFDSRGARVRRFAGDSPGALHELRWDGHDAAGRPAAPGVYFARLTASGAQRVARAVKLE